MIHFETYNVRHDSHHRRHVRVISARATGLNVQTINANVVAVIKMVRTHFWRLARIQAIVPKIKTSFRTPVRMYNIFTLI